MSGFSPVTLSLLGLVFVVALCLSILAVRRDHPDHVHTLWYVFSLTLCSVSVLFLPPTIWNRYRWCCFRRVALIAGAQSRP